MLSEPVETMVKLDWRQRYTRALDNLLAERDDVTRHLHWIAGVDPAVKAGLLSPALRDATRSGTAEALLEPYLGAASAGDGDVIHRLMALDVHTWLVDDVLTKMDRMSMAVSVEARVPLLDHRLVEYVAGLPLAVKLRHGPKTLLKHAMRSKLPAATLRRRKHAFQVPLDQWVGGPLRGFVRDMLLDKRARERGWIDTARLDTLLGGNGEPLALDGQSVWTLLSLELWAREVLDRTRSSERGTRNGRGDSGDAEL